MITMHRTSYLQFILRSFIPLASLLSGAGCATSASEESEVNIASSAAELTTAPAVLSFNGDSTIYRTNDLRADQAFTLRYDTARLAGCRGTYHGGPAFTITAFVQSGSAAPIAYPVAGFSSVQSVVLATGGVASVTIPAQPAGALSVWFQETNIYGCMNYDSNLGSNYRFTVEAAPVAGGVTPDFLGNAAFVVSRATCNGLACDDGRVNATQGFSYDTWARQRAAIAGIYFDSWKAGYTDRENPDLWQQMDAKLFYRFGSNGAFLSVPANIEKRVGNDVRYSVSLKALDPLGGYPRATKADCPKGKLRATADGQYVEVPFEYYAQVGSRQLRPSSASSVFTGKFVDYRNNFEVCLK
jgi:Family of unknown function (DUF6209)